MKQIPVPELDSNKKVITVFENMDYQLQDKRIKMIF